MSEPIGTYPFAQRCPFQEAQEYAWLRAHRPVAQVTMPNGATAWLVTRRADVRAVLADERFNRRKVRVDAVRRDAPAGARDSPAGARDAPAEASGTHRADGVHRSGGQRGGGQRGGGQPVGEFDFGVWIADQADHTRWRRAVRTILTPDFAEAMRPRVGEFVEETLDEIAPASGPVDLVREFAFRVPIRVICALFDVPTEQQAVFDDWTEALRTVGNSTATFGAAMGLLYGCATELVAQARQNHGNGTLGKLAAFAPDGEPAMSDQELISTILLLTVAGYETTAVQLANGLMALFQHPEQLELLKRDTSLIGPAVEEILRYAQAGTGFAGATYTTVDVEVGGVTIPAGSAVFASIDSASRDGAHVTDPDRFDITRGSANQHLAFGAGSHYCLGAPLARVELQEAVGRIFRRFPTLRLVDRPENVAFTSNLFSRFPQTLTVVA